MTMGAALRELAAGLAGVAAMTAAEKLEQAFSHRPIHPCPGTRWSGCSGYRASPTRSGCG